MLGQDWRLDYRGQPGMGVHGGHPSTGVHGEVRRLLTSLSSPQRVGFSLHVALPGLRGRVTWVW